jgi:class 3 adenylate cyclase
MGLLKFYTKHFLTSKNVQHHNNKFFRITQGAYLLGLLLHLSLILMYKDMGVQEMVFFNVLISVPAFIIAIFLNKLGKHNIGFLIVFMELLCHQIATTYYIGWGSGANYWLIYLAGLSFFNSNWKLRVHLSLLSIVIAAYILLFIFLQEGIYSLDLTIQQDSELSSAIAVMIVLPLLIYYFVQSASKAEQKLIVEKSLSTRMLKKIEGLFGQQVSKEVAVQMMDSEQDIESKSYDVTIMFLDIRDFTLFADTKDASEIAKFQNIVFSNLIDIVQSKNGVVLQLLGDGIMAVFGAPIENAKHHNYAYQASLDILDCIQSLIKSKQIPKIKIGIGLNSGTIIAGNLGNDSRKSYSLTGKNVIIAARIESLNKQFNSQFLISESVFSNLSYNKDNIASLGPVNLKGIENPVTIYQVV